MDYSSSTSLADMPSTSAASAPIPSTSAASTLAPSISAASRKRKKNFHEEILEEIRVGNEIAERSHAALAAVQERSANTQAQFLAVEQERNELFRQFNEHARATSNEMLSILKAKK